MNNANTTTEPDATEDIFEIHPRVLTGALITGLIIAVIVGAASFKLSFSTLLDLAVMAGINPSDAWVIPVALDGPILAAAVIRIALSQHTDAATRRGRRLVVAVLAVSAILSIAGNAYHAVLTATVLNAAVAAAIAALAPAMVLTMSEIVAVVLRAPRRRRVAALLEAPAEDVVAGAAEIDNPHHHETEQPAAILGIAEDLDNGMLKPAVWTSVNLYLTNPDWSISSIARHLDVHTSTVSRHIKTFGPTTVANRHSRPGACVRSRLQPPSPQFIHHCDRTFFDRGEVLGRTIAPVGCLFTHLQLRRCCIEFLDTHALDRCHRLLPRRGTPR